MSHTHRGIKEDIEYLYDKLKGWVKDAKGIKDGAGKDLAASIEEYLSEFKGEKGLGGQVKARNNWL